MMRMLNQLRLRKEIVWAAILFAIPIGIAAYLYMPSYARFSALGEIVPVREVGVEGSVYFTYVREGYARNRFEMWSLRHALKGDIRFEPAEPEVADEYEALTEAGENERDETIRHALESVEQSATAMSSPNEEDDDELERKVRRISEQASRYYGDSLGLMLAIGLAEETEGIDFSNGGETVIAGTGTLNADRTVGSVGSIRDKLLTAEKGGAELFFVPKDKDRFGYGVLSNQEEAEQVVKEERLRLKVVPVGTLDEALEYLRKLSR